MKVCNVLFGIIPTLSLILFGWEGKKKGAHKIIKLPRSIY